MKALKSLADHRRDVETIRADLLARARKPRPQPITLRRCAADAHSTRDPAYKSGSHRIDISALDRVLALDSKQRQAVVEPLCPMDELVDHTLRRGLMPAVVPEFKGITVGGAVQGLGIESSSIRHGILSDGCESLDLLLGDASLVTASRCEHADLFAALPGSFGSLALLVKATLDLVPARRYVHLHYLRLPSRRELRPVLEALTAPGPEAPEFVDGILFDRHTPVLIAGRPSGQRRGCAIYRDHPWNMLFYHHVGKAAGIAGRGAASQPCSLAGHPAYRYCTAEELMPIKQYLFRYDKGAFWMLPLKIREHPWKQSLLFWRLSSRQLFAWAMSIPYAAREEKFFIQDGAVPLNRLPELLEWVINKLAIYPLWLCPIMSRPPKKLFAQPGEAKGEQLINVGIYGVPKAQPFDYLQRNREFERLLKSLGGSKGLYAMIYYDQQEFWSQYDHERYRAVRAKYHADGTFMDIYDKLTSSRYPAEAAPSSTDQLGNLRRG